MALSLWTKLLTRRWPYGHSLASVPAVNRTLHLAPPFLLDDYVPRYQMLSSRDAARKRASAYAHLRECNLCPRLCGVNRFETTGMCMIGDTAKVNVIAPHFGEDIYKLEPCIQGHNGSGAVFMSGCNMRCVFCQNYDISHRRNGMDLTAEDLGEWYVKLQDVGNVHNINIVTPEHVVPQIALSILHARDLGLKLPIVYNTSSYDSPASLELMDGLVDIYLADFKVWKPETSRRLLKAENYPSTARESICAMFDQVGDLCFTADGLAKRGLLVRHLVMPGKQDEGAEIMRFLASHVSKDCFVNVMEQYRPDAHVGNARRRRRIDTEAYQGNIGASAPKSAATVTVTVTANHGSSTGDGDRDTADATRYAELNRAVTLDEVSLVRQAAIDAGLWRFNDAPKHNGFAI